MKTACVILMVVGVAVGQFVANPGPAPAAGGAPAAAGGAPAAGGAAGANKYGPRVYGMGLNNPWAFPPHPFMMQRALALLNQTPGALLRVDADGSLAFTNRFGQDVDITDMFGNELSDLID